MAGGEPLTLRRPSFAEGAGSRDPQGGVRTRPGSKKTAAAAAVEGRFPMKTVAEVIGVSHSNLIDKGTLPSPLLYATKSFPPG